MKESDLKNIVILKNLPSNIVDEAIVILKTGKMIKKVKKIEKNKGAKKEENNSRQENYILKEAEMLINGYVDKIENTKKEYKEKSKDIKYMRIKKYAYITTVLLIIESLIILVK